MEQLSRCAAGARRRRALGDGRAGAGAGRAVRGPGRGRRRPDPLGRPRPRGPRARGGPPRVPGADPADLAAPRGGLGRDRYLPGVVLQRGRPDGRRRRDRRRVRARARLHRALRAVRPGRPARPPLVGRDGLRGRRRGPADGAGGGRPRRPGRDRSEPGRRHVLRRLHGVGQDPDGSRRRDEGDRHGRRGIGDAAGRGSGPAALDAAGAARPRRTALGGPGGLAGDRRHRRRVHVLRHRPRAGDGRDRRDAQPRRAARRHRPGRGRPRRADVGAGRGGVPAADGRAVPGLGPRACAARAGTARYDGVHATGAVKVETTTGERK